MSEKPKYIIPKNYDFKPKLFGVIEYKLGVFLSSLILFLVIIFQNINISAIMKLQIIIIVVIPILMVGTIGVRGEKFFDILKLLLSYYLKPKIYFYSKIGLSFFWEWREKIKNRLFYKKEKHEC